MADVSARVLRKTGAWRQWRSLTMRFCVRRLSMVTLCVIALAGASVVSTARADDKDVIDYREHVMNTLNEQSAALGQILSLSVPDDSFAAPLEAIALAASAALKSFEPKVPGGEAKPEVWAQ